LLHFEETMHQRAYTIATAQTLFLIMALASSLNAFAQAPQPITSLPKPPKAAAATVTPAQPAPPAQPAAETAPAQQPTPATDTPAPVVTIQTPPATQPPPPAPPAPDATPLHLAVQKTKIARPIKKFHAFSTVALGVKGGFAGVGVDLATPLAQRFNLRAGGSFYSYSGSYNVDGTTINGEAKFRSGNASIDIFPFNNGFRISPGVTFYNGNNLNATAYVPASQEFDLGDANYYSSLTDPVHGTASMTFGSRIAPSITIGFGNMIPRSGRHFSFPFEIGIEYLRTPPMISLFLQGTACPGNPNTPGFDPTTCAQVQNDPTTQANLQQEENEINNDIKLLRFYPIISQGFAVRF
jgi:hypothetical protein